MLSERISQLEIQFNHVWLSLDVRRDIIKVIRIFSHIRSLTISLHVLPKNLPQILKELLTKLLKCQQNLLCITIDDTLAMGFESFIRQGGLDFIQTGLSPSLKPSSHLELKPSSITIWL